MRRLRFAIDSGWRGGGGGEDAGGRRRGSLHWLYTVAQSGAVRVGPGSDLSETDDVTRNALNPVSLRRVRADGGGADEADKNTGVTSEVSASGHGQRGSGGGAVDGVKERSECDRGMRTYRVQHCKEQSCDIVAGLWVARQRSLSALQKKRTQSRAGNYETNESSKTPQHSLSR